MICSPDFCFVFKEHYWCGKPKGSSPHIATENKEETNMKHKMQFWNKEYCRDDIHTCSRQQEHLSQHSKTPGGGGIISSVVVAWLLRTYCALMKLENIPYHFHFILSSGFPFKLNSPIHDSSTTCPPTMWYMESDLAFKDVLLSFPSCDCQNQAWLGTCAVTLCETSLYNHRNGKNLELSVLIVIILR